MLDRVLHRATIVAAMVELCLSLPTVARAQEIDLDASFECFGAMWSSVQQTVKSCPDGVIRAEYLVGSGKFGSDITTAVFDRLEGLALTAANRQLGMRALLVILLSARQVEGGGAKYVDLGERIENMYLGTQDPLVRSNILGPAIHLMADRERAVHILTLAATEVNAGDRLGDIPAAQTAINQLWQMGEPGKVVVRRLVQEGSISAPRALARAQQLIRGSPGGR